MAIVDLLFAASMKGAWSAPTSMPKKGAHLGLKDPLYRSLPTGSDPAQSKPKK